MNYHYNSGIKSYSTATDEMPGGPQQDASLFEQKVKKRLNTEHLQSIINFVRLIWGSLVGSY
jgi:hypothetical protein